LEITTGTASLLSPKEQDQQVLEQRRIRREEEKARKKAQAEKAAAKKAQPKNQKKAKPATAAPEATSSLVVPTSSTTVRRAAKLTPMESNNFDPGHVLAGWVVMTEVPFDAIDPTAPEMQAKIRPAVVVAASAEGVLVRGIYSNDGMSRSLFQPWRRVGLDHVSYIDDAHTVVSVDAELTKLAKLTDDEWNALI
jgi:hypothetical protein